MVEVAHPDITAKYGPDILQVCDYMVSISISILSLLFGSKLGFSWILDSLSSVLCDDVHAFGYNSAKSEPMWMKSGAVWVHCLRLALADFGRNPRSSKSWTARWNCVFCQVSNAWFHRFPIVHISQNLNTTRCLVWRWILLEQNFENFPVRGHFNKKCKKKEIFFQRLATSGRHNSAMIIDRWKFINKWSLYGKPCLYFYR